MIGLKSKIAIRNGWDRLRYALLFELLLVAMLGFALPHLVDRSAANTLALAAVLSAMALLINLLFNNIYDRVDVYCGRIPTVRTLAGRVVHAVGFEFILALASLPIMMWWLGLSFWRALLLDLGMMSAIVVYTFLFTLVYDKYFPLLQPGCSTQKNVQARS